MNKQQWKKWQPRAEKKFKTLISLKRAKHAKKYSKKIKIKLAVEDHGRDEAAGLSMITVAEQAKWPLQSDENHCRGEQTVSIGRPKTIDFICFCSLSISGWDSHDLVFSTQRTSTSEYGSLTCGRGWRGSTGDAWKPTKSRYSILHSEIRLLQ